MEGNILSKKKQLIEQIKNNLAAKILIRKDLLELVGIDFCLECWKNNEYEDNGFCQNCNENKGKEATE